MSAHLRAAHSGVCDEHSRAVAQVVTPASERRAGKTADAALMIQVARSHLHSKLSRLRNNRRVLQAGQARGGAIVGARPAEL